MGRDVDYAGEVRFAKSGQIKSWDNKSGHYEPPEKLASQAGLPMDKFRPTEIV